MDFYVDIGVAVLLRILRDRQERKLFRTAFLKLFAATWRAFGDDSSFRQVVEPVDDIV